MHVACMKVIQVANKKPIFHRLTANNKTCTLGLIVSRLKDNFNQSFLKEIFFGKYMC